MMQDKFPMGGAFSNSFKKFQVKQQSFTFLVFRQKVTVTVVTLLFHENSFGGQQCLKLSKVSTGHVSHTYVFSSRTQYLVASFFDFIEHLFHPDPLSKALSVSFKYSQA